MPPPTDTRVQVAGFSGPNKQAGEGVERVLQEA